MMTNTKHKTPSFEFDAATAVFDTNVPILLRPPTTRFCCFNDDRIFPGHWTLSGDFVFVMVIHTNSTTALTFAEKLTFDHFPFSSPFFTHPHPLTPHSTTPPGLHNTVQTVWRCYTLQAHTMQVRQWR